MRSLRYLNVVLTVLCVLMALQLWTAWNGSGSAPSLATPALAGPGSAALTGTPGTGGGIPDAGAQRKEMIDTLKHLSVQQDDLAAFFKSGQLRVRMDTAPNGGNRPG